jgi:hypothetical protein
MFLLLAGLAGCEGASSKEQASEEPAAALVGAAPAARATPAATAAAQGAKALTPAAPARPKSEPRTFALDTVPKFESTSDVGGIRLGMTIDEALAVLDARAGKVLFHYSIQTLTPEGNVATLPHIQDRKRVLPLKPNQVITEIERGSPFFDEESFKVVFALPPDPNVVAAVSMTINARKDLAKATLASALLEAVGKKYGPEYTSAPQRPNNPALDNVAYRWLMSPGEDCYTSFTIPAMDVGGLSAWAQHPSSSAYQSAPQPGACATGVLLRAGVQKDGEFKGVAAMYTLTLGNEGAHYHNAKRNEALVAARKQEWLEQRQKQVAEGAAAPKL